MNSLQKYNVSFRVGTHNGKSVIFITFPYDKDLHERVKKLPGCKWSSSHKSWYVLDNEFYRTKFKLTPKQVISEGMLSEIQPINIPAIQRLVDELQLKCLSKNTINTYKNEFAQLLYKLGNISVNDLTPDDLRRYFLYCLEMEGISENHLHSRINAVKFYFEKVLKRDKFFFEIPRPKKPSLLPKVIDSGDILKMIEITQNKKHKLMLELCYGMGLRVSEITNLKITDIDGKRLQVLIEAAKGKKDRYVNLPQSVLKSLREYYLLYKPKYYLFEGQYGDRYSNRSVQQVFYSALKKARINKRVGIHSLRHSYATHLLEYGTDITYIQKLLGHNDIKTTQLYAHVSKKSVANIVSPLDRIQLKLE